jgi:hypothetical protein
MPPRVQSMQQTVSADEASVETEWEPELLPLYDQLEYPRPSPRHDDSHESDQGSRVIVIDLA